MSREIDGFHSFKFSHVHTYIRRKWNRPRHVVVLYVVTTLYIQTVQSETKTQVTAHKTVYVLYVPREKGLVLHYRVPHSCFGQILMVSRVDRIDSASAQRDHPPLPFRVAQHRSSSRAAW